MSAVPSWEDPRVVLRRHGLAPKKRFSQNFLVSRSAVERIASALELGLDETVVEIGAGLGTLTGALLRTGAKVIAIEPDRDMLSVLAREFDGVPNLTVIDGDATEIDLSALAGAHGGKITLAGNLPYAVTGALLRRAVESRTSIRSAAFMMQREVRDRLLAQPGTKEYGALTVFVRGVFTVESLFLLSPGSFHPPPKVTSAVLRFIPHDHPAPVDDETFRSVVRASFEARRKTLRNALLRIAEADHVDRALAGAGIDGIRRGETLSIEEFARLALALAAS